MRVTVTLSDDYVEFLDRYAADHAMESRSDVVQRALLLLRTNELDEDYTAAWDDWDASGGDAWDCAVGDGLPTGT